MKIVALAVVALLLGATALYLSMVLIPRGTEEPDGDEPTISITSTIPP